jgi:hypothetical protein
MRKPGSYDGNLSLLLSVKNDVVTCRLINDTGEFGFTLIGGTATRPDGLSSTVDPELN